MALEKRNYEIMKRIIILYPELGRVVLKLGSRWAKIVPLKLYNVKFISLVIHA